LDRLAALGSAGLTGTALNTLKTGDVAFVDRIASANGATKRLADMGFVRGARLELLRAGAPCIVRLNGVCIGLGLAYQTSIMVGPV
jgi:Fe2+ transport system protein FeoA